MDLRKRIRVGVIGGAAPEARFREMAFEVGRLIAEKEAILVCGGLGGVMDSAARGAKQAGGMTVGILPGGSPKDANPHIDIAVATGMGYSRNNLVVMNSDVLIAVNGSFSGRLQDPGISGCPVRPFEPTPQVEHPGQDYQEDGDDDVQGHPFQLKFP